jgi:hypothetical protein
MSPKRHKPEEFTAILDLMHTGMSMKKACRQTGMSHYTFRDALARDKQLFDAYKIAQQFMMEARLEECDELCDKLTAFANERPADMQALRALLIDAGAKHADDPEWAEFIDKALKLAAGNPPHSQAEVSAITSALRHNEWKIGKLGRPDLRDNRHKVEVEGEVEISLANVIREKRLARLENVRAS